MRIVDRSRRNRVFVVTSDGEHGLVKQAYDGGPTGLRHEMTVRPRLCAADRPTGLIYLRPLV